ncbi:MAG: transposase, partial [Schwartzia sp.]|nr:transposase [Schwartzia sp. (in: firmicutes)]
MQIGLFDEEERMEKLSRSGDSRVRLNSVIQWEIFRPVLEKALHKEPKGAGGRPPYDSLLMFKILILQRIYNLSDDQAEFRINDRRSFMRFLGLNLEDRVPDAKTIWLFRDNLVKADVMRELFATFSRQLDAAHLITRTGTIVDTTF